MNKLLLLLFIVIFSGCNLKDEVASLSALDDDEKIWVFTQINVREEEDGLESYYYYANISQTLYNAIKNNQITSGFILLENVKYWGSDELIYDYKDIENSGELVFRIENIVRLTFVNIEPIAGKGHEQFEESHSGDPTDSESSPPEDENPNNSNEKDSVNAVTS